MTKNEFILKENVRASSALPTGPWISNEITDALTYPTPLSFSLFKKILSPGGSTGIAMKRLGLFYDSTVTMDDYCKIFYGKFYINKAIGKQLITPRLLIILKYNFTQAQLDINLIKYIKFVWKDIIVLLKSHNNHQIPQNVTYASFKKYSEKFIYSSYPLGVMANILAEKIASSNIDTLKLVNIFNSNDLEILNSYYFKGVNKLETEDEWELKAKKSTNQQTSNKKQKKIINNKAQLSAIFKTAIKTILLEEFNILSKLSQKMKLPSIDSEYNHFLTLEELDKNNLPSMKILKEREMEYDIGKTIELPEILSRNFTIDERPISHKQTKNNVQVLKGNTIVNKPFKGTARVIKSNADIELLTEKQVMVTTSASPQWTVGIYKAGALLTERGNQLSHLSIVAREKQVPSIVGVANLLQSVNTGDTIKIDCGGSIHIEKKVVVI